MRPRAPLEPCDDQFQGRSAVAPRTSVTARTMRARAGFHGIALFVGVVLVTISHKLAEPPASAAARVPMSVSPARVQVTADEYTLVLSRSAIKAGPAVIELVNLGEDEHDLAIRRVGPGAVTRRIATVSPGSTGDLSRRLRAGRFVLWCTLADHRARGMRATLILR